MSRDYREFGRAEQEFDARHFLEAIYAGQPEGTLLAVGPLSKPHFCCARRGALPYVVGKRDVYARMTLLGNARTAAARPPTRRAARRLGRGRPQRRAESAAAIVTTAPPTSRPRSSSATACSRPRLLCGSGYGVHAYWLFERPWDVRRRGRPRRSPQAGRGLAAPAAPRGRARSGSPASTPRTTWRVCCACRAP